MASKQLELSVIVERSRETDSDSVFLSGKNDASPFFGCIITYCCAAFIYMIVNVFSILQIVIAVKYKNDIDCESPIGLPIYHWLLIDAIVFSITFAILFASVIYTLTKFDQTFKIVDRVASFLMIPHVLFNFSWLLIGSLVFWRDCIDVQPNKINALMWTTLIIKWFILLMTLLTSRVKLNK
uniref:Uncharacterized protein n=1 Tax=viral metagenome TaxID=1070528 RepID=A0A6C0EBY9_9ZZZZ